ncbi:MAG: hypothetical protein ABIJ39_01025 [Chloroflexota bacterium]
MSDKHCLNCNRSEQDIPLVSLQYRGDQAHICSQCFPMLIHAPGKLAGKLEGADSIPPAEHDH